jgi:hypothetical protein
VWRAANGEYRLGAVVFLWFANKPDNASVAEFQQGFTVSLSFAFSLYPFVHSGFNPGSSSYAACYFGARRTITQAHWFSPALLG